MDPFWIESKIGLVKTKEAENILPESDRYFINSLSATILDLATKMNKITDSSEDKEKKRLETISAYKKNSFQPDCVVLQNTHTNDAFIRLEYAHERQSLINSSQDPNISQPLRSISRDFLYAADKETKKHPTIDTYKKFSRATRAINNVIKTPNDKSFEECEQQAKELNKKPWGRKLAALMGIVLGVSLIIASGFVFVASLGLSAPISLPGIAIGASLIAGGVSIATAGIGFAAATTGVALFKKSAVVNATEDTIKEVKKTMKK